ncbi:hypothetical protein Bca52824_011446 [Brassica carinata]|uniref:Uncharacterized protein n=1 Tax=Brassica carinata TaxID=52824 RepID=A0A8X8BBU2_BRACI|nr:hypothetical protein Bca52824_011446 [Brassica carinata]
MLLHIEVLRRRRRREVAHLRSVSVKRCSAPLAKRVPLTVESPGIDGQVVVKLTFERRKSTLNQNQNRKGKQDSNYIFTIFGDVKLILLEQQEQVMIEEQKVEDAGTELKTLEDTSKATEPYKSPNSGVTKRKEKQISSSSSTFSALSNLSASPAYRSLEEKVLKIQALTVVTTIREMFLEMIT